MSRTQDDINDKLEMLQKVDKWTTKAEYKLAHPELSYAMMRREIDRGNIAAKLDIDGKIKLNAVQADYIFGYAGQRPNLFD